MSRSKIVRSCSGCPYYYRHKVDKGANQSVLFPFPVRHCDINNNLDCELYSTGKKSHIMRGVM